MRIPTSIAQQISFTKPHKKGIYFTIEAVIAMMVISIGFGIILYLFVVLSKPPLGIVQTDLYNTVDLFSFQLQDISNGTCSASGNATDNGNITDTSMTLMNQLGEFYYRYTARDCDYCDDLLRECILEFVDYRDIHDNNLQISIEGTAFYANGTIDQENATVLLPFKMLLFGTRNNTEMWGPYLGEIRVWQ
jgi:hypothetical protein